MGTLQPQAALSPLRLEKRDKAIQEDALLTVPFLPRLALRHNLDLEEKDLECLIWLVLQESQTLCTSRSHTVTLKFNLGRQSL